MALLDSTATTKLSPTWSSGAFRLSSNSKERSSSTSSTFSTSSLARISSKSPISMVQCSVCLDKSQLYLLCGVFRNKKSHVLLRGHCWKGLHYELNACSWSLKYSCSLVHLPYQPQTSLSQWSVWSLFVWLWDMLSLAYSWMEIFRNSATSLTFCNFMLSDFSCSFRSICLRQAPASLWGPLPWPVAQKLYSIRQPIGSSSHTMRDGYLYKVSN